VKAQVTLAIILLSFATAAHLIAADGFLIVQTTTMNGKTQTIQVQIEKDKIRAEMITSTGEKQAAVFDGSKQVLSLINYDRKSYTEMTREDVERIGGQMSELMARIQEQMANMPPAQRAQMESMMRGRMGGFAAGVAKPEYRKAGTDKAGKWTCDKYEGFVNNEKVSEVCTVEPRAFNATAEDFEIAKQLAQFAQKLIPQGFERIFAVGSTEAQGYSGIPVRQISYRDGQPVTINEVTDVRRETFDEAGYRIPADFQKQLMPGGRGGQ